MVIDAVSANVLGHVQRFVGAAEHGCRDQVVAGLAEPHTDRKLDFGDLRARMAAEMPIFVEYMKKLREKAG